MTSLASVGPQTRYFEALAAGKWQIQRCRSCTRAVFYPRLLCPHCASSELEWFEPSGCGVVYSTTCVSRRPEAGGNYNVALVDLDEGARMMSRVEGVPPENVHIGMRVKAAVAKGPHAEAIVVFSPAEVQP